MFFIPVKLRELEKLKIENEKLKKLNNRLDLENLSLKNQLNFGKTNTRIITSKNKYRVVEYILPFFSERFENEQIGYFSEKTLYKNKKKGYLDILEDYILVFFGSGKSILIDKKKLENQEFDYKDLKNNLSELNLFDQKISWAGVKDIKIDKDKVYLSITKEFKNNCYQTELLVGNLDIKKYLLKTLQQI